MRANQTIGFIDGLKYVFGSSAYARLVGKVGNPTNAQDSQVAAYAESYFEYDTLHRVTTEVVAGAGTSLSSTPGLGIFTYSYANPAIVPQPDDSDLYNSWKYCTTEILPSNMCQKKFYANVYGEVMLTTTDTGLGQKWDTYYLYDNNPDDDDPDDTDPDIDGGRIIMVANPSAFASNSSLNNGSFDTRYPDLDVDLQESQGLITKTDYYAQTNVTVKRILEA